MASEYKFDIIQIIKNGFDHIKSDRDPEKYAAMAYFPFIGWIPVLLFRKNQELCRFHLIQALKLNLGFIFIYLIIWILQDFPILSNILNLLYFNPIVTNFLHYLNWSTFLVLSFLGFLKSLHKEFYTFPFFPFLEKKIILFLEELKLRIEKIGK